MTGTPRPRFSVRLQLADDVDLAPYDGVPPHLLAPLQLWVQELLSPTRRPWAEQVARDICLTLRISKPGSHTATFAKTLGNEVGLTLLDVIDQLLSHADDKQLTLFEEWTVGELGVILDAGGSAYRVNHDGDGLEERIVPGVREAVHTAVAGAASVSTAGSAAEHLAKAWETAYGLQPDPVRSYNESIKAVESAAHSVLQPNHPKATLGTMLGELGNIRHKLTVAFSTGPKSDPVAMVEGMMRTLWEGQTSRHGGQAGTPPETLDSARSAVHLAATLVQWFVSGAVSRR